MSSASPPLQDVPAAPQIPVRLDGRGWTLLLTLAFLWSISFIFIRVAAEDIPILTLVLVRIGLAAAVLHAVVLLSGRRYPKGSNLWAGYGLMGLFNNILPGIFIVFATAQIGAGAASILNATVPIFSLLIAHVTTLDDRITARRLVGIALGFLGVAAMSGPKALAGIGDELPAVAAMLIATFCYGLSNSLGRRFTGIDPIVSATCQLSAATLMLAPFALIADQPWTLPMPGLPAVLSAVGLALVSTALAYVLFFQLLARAGGTNTSLVTLLIPAGGVGLAWLLLDEPLTLAKLAGMLLIAAGLVVIDGRWRARRAPLPLAQRGRGGGKGAARKGIGLPPSPALPRKGRGRAA